MADPQQRAGSEIGAKDDIEMRLGANLVHLPIVRAVAVNIAMRADFDVDAISDLELAVDEACSSLITHAVAGSVLGCRFTIGANEITFAVSVTSAEDVTPSESTFGWRVLTTLTDDVASWADQLEDSQHQVHIEFIKRKPVVTR